MKPGKHWSAMRKTIYKTNVVLDHFYSRRMDYSKVRAVAGDLRKICGRKFKLGEI